MAAKKKTVLLTKAHRLLLETCREQKAHLDAVAGLLVANGLHSQRMFDPVHVTVLQKALSDPARGFASLQQRLEIGQQQVEATIADMSDRVNDIMREVAQTRQALRVLASPKIDAVVRKILGFDGPGDGEEDG